MRNLEIQLAYMKDKVREAATLEERLNALNTEVEDHKQRLHKSETEKIEIQRYAHELLDKVKKDSEALEFMVDRRIINQFLINYANPISTN